ncbi:hypothetical protein N306_15363, partial [Opisthocomus hoazin]
ILMKSSHQGSQSTEFWQLQHFPKTRKTCTAHRRLCSKAVY